MFNIQVPARWVKASYAKLIELNKDVRDAETQGMLLRFFYVCLFFFPRGFARRRTI